MNPFEHVRMALDALAANKVRAFLTMLGVIIGVASVIMLVAIGEGAKTYIRTELMGIGTNLLIIVPGKTETSGAGQVGTSGIRKLTIGDMRALEKRTTLLRAMAAVVASNAPVKYRNRLRNVQIVGTDQNFPTVRNLHAEIGAFISRSDVDARRRVAVLGRTVRTELFGETNPLGRMIKIGETKFRVIGIMGKKGMTLGMDIDDHVFIPVETAQEIFDRDGLTNILAQVINESEIDRAKEQVRTVLTERHGEEDFTVVSQQAMLSTMQGILSTFTYVLGGIASISLLVGGIGIMNIMLVSVRERTREIGLRKAIGASRRDILLQFVIESVALSVVGGIIGILIGAGVAYGAKAAFPVIPVDVTAWSVAMAFIFAFLVGAFFGIYPAVKAARLNPIDALRYE